MREINESAMTTGSTETRGKSSGPDAVDGRTPPASAKPWSGLSATQLSVARPAGGMKRLSEFVCRQREDGLVPVLLHQFQKRD